MPRCFADGSRAAVVAFWAPEPEAGSDVGAYRTRAELPPAELVELYGGSGIDPRRHHRSLERLRADGDAVNQGATEDGVTAVGVAVHGRRHRAVCAISVSMPTTRFTRAMLPALGEVLTTTRADLEAAAGPS